LKLGKVLNQGIERHSFGLVAASAALVSRGRRNVFRREGQRGQKLAYIYFEDEPGRISAAKLLERDEARRIAVNIAKLPELLGRRQTWGVR